MNTKLLILIFISIFSFTASAADLPADTIKNLELFSKKKLNETDLEEVKKSIEILVKLDDEDPSRTAVLMLSKSYSDHPALYDRAIKQVENKENRKKLSEIRLILRNYFKKGNG